MWKDAATQIFFSLGLGYGGALAFSSYNDQKNDCKKDAIIVTIVNCGTSILASIVVFAISGFRAYNRALDCTSMSVRCKLFETFNQIVIYRSLNKTNDFISLHPKVYNRNVTSLDYSKAFEKINFTVYDLYDPNTTNLNVS